MALPPRTTYGPEEIRQTLWQTAVLTTKLLSFVSVVLAHLVLNWLAGMAAPVGSEKVVYFLEVIFFACFAVVYVQLAFDMVTIYVPALRRSNG